MAYWPEVFTDPDFEYQDTKQAQEEAKADAWLGWGLCLMRKEPPEGFGAGMVKILKAIGLEEFKKITPKR